MTTSDPSKLWYPPFQRLSDALESLRADPTCISSKDLSKQLQPYASWLAVGIHGFQPPSPSSKSMLQQQTSLSVGTSKLPIEAPLCVLALQLSAALVCLLMLYLGYICILYICMLQYGHSYKPSFTQHLDEIQSYVLLRRWWSTLPNREEDPITTPPTVLSAANLQDLAVLLCRERTFLLNALESLLRLAHGVCLGCVFGSGMVWNGVGWNTGFVLCCFHVYCLTMAPLHTTIATTMHTSHQPHVRFHTRGHQGCRHHHPQRCPCCWSGHSLV